MGNSRRRIFIAVIFILIILVHFYGFLRMTRDALDLTVCDAVSGIDLKSAEKVAHAGLTHKVNLNDGYNQATMLSVMHESDLRKLSAEIQTKISERQNPDNCDEAKLLVYDIHSWPCGFGCTTHVTLMHFVVAFYTNRTFVFKSDGWAYDNKGWDHYLMPLGKCDYNGEIKHLPIISDKTSNVRIVRSTSMNKCSKCDWKIPRNVLARIKNIHNDPYAWWIGQFVNYQLRFQPWFQEVLTNKLKQTPLTNSTVGIQIRWGDKVGVEANKHPVSEYMELAAKWFDQPDHKGVHRTVFVATEQSEAWKNLQDNYNSFSFIGSGFVNPNKELDYRKGPHYDKRPNELDAILMDIYLLSKCNHVVCTFSSNICRLLYEKIAADKNEPKYAIESLDDQYYWFINMPKFRAIEIHDTKGNKHELDMDIEDIFELSLEHFDVTRQGYVYGIDLGIGIDLEIGLTIRNIFASSQVGFNHKKYGYIRGTNTRTGLKGLVPKYKLQMIVEPLDFDI